MNQTIIDAIRNRQLLAFTYKGHHRVVQPHTYGTLRTGHVALRAYQVGGTSGSGHIPDWRIFHIAELHGVSVQTTTFARAAPGYRANDPEFATIFEQIKPAAR